MDKFSILIPPFNTPLPSIVNDFPFPVTAPSVIDPAVEVNVILSPSVTVPEYVCVPAVVISSLIVVVPLTDKMLISVPPFKTPLPDTVNVFPFPVMCPSVTNPAVEVNVTLPSSVTTPVYV